MCVEEDAIVRCYVMNLKSEHNENETMTMMAMLPAANQKVRVPCSCWWLVVWMSKKARKRNVTLLWAKGMRV